MNQPLSYSQQSKQQYLMAMLYVISAEGSELFTQLPESIQSLYLAACAELAQECVAPLDQPGTTLTAPSST